MSDKDTPERPAQVGWRSPVRADGVIDGNWWYYDLAERTPPDAEPVFAHRYTVDAILIGAEPYPCSICGRGREHHDTPWHRTVV